METVLIFNAVFLLLITFTATVTTQNQDIDVKVGGVDAETIQDILDGHNKLRAKVANGEQSGQPSASNMQELIWNKGLANGAQRWSDRCQFGHDENRKTPEFPDWVGQNVASTSSSSSDGRPEFSRSAIAMWFGEVKDFDPSSVGQFTFSGNTGHYTQLVWAKTHAVGCGFTLCGDDEKYYVCNYGPGGNFGRQSVYETGSPCTDCENGCSTRYPGLCSTKTPTDFVLNEDANFTSGPIKLTDRPAPNNNQSNYGHFTMDYYNSTTISTSTDNSTSTSTSTVVPTTKPCYSTSNPDTTTTNDPITSMSPNSTY